MASIRGCSSYPWHYFIFKIFVHLFQLCVSTVNTSLSHSRVSKQDAQFMTVCGFFIKLKRNKTATRQQSLKGYNLQQQTLNPVETHDTYCSLLFSARFWMFSYCKARNDPFCSSSAWYVSLLPALMQTSVWPVVHFPRGVGVVISTCPAIITAAHGKKAPVWSFQYIISNWPEASRHPWPVQTTGPSWTRRFYIWVVISDHRGLREMWEAFLCSGSLHLRLRIQDGRVSDPTWFSFRAKRSLVDTRKGWLLFYWFFLEGNALCYFN